MMWFLKSWEETGNEAKMLIQHAHKQAATKTNEKMVSVLVVPDFAALRTWEALMLAGYQSSAH